MDADEVRLAEQWIELAARHAQLLLHLRGGWELVVVDDAHAERPGATSHAAPDATETHDAQRGATDVVPEQHVDRPAGKGAAADETVGLEQPAAGRHQQGEGEIGGGVVEDSGRVGDHDAVPGGGGDVDVVVADRHVGDDLEPGGAQDLLADRIHQLGDHALRSLRRLPQRLDRVSVLVGKQAQLGRLPQQGRAGLEDRVRQHDHRPRFAQGCNPSCAAMGLRASRTVATCSSKGTPSSSAPVSSSSR